MTYNVFGGTLNPTLLLKPRFENKNNYYMHVWNATDVQQSATGACGLKDIAVKVATRVIGHYPHRNQLMIDAGWMALSLDGQDKLPTGSYCVFQDHPELR